MGVLEAFEYSSNECVGRDYTIRYFHSTIAFAEVDAFHDRFTGLVRTPARGATILAIVPPRFTVVVY